MKKFPKYIQHDAMDCGPTCLRIISKYYGKNYTQNELRNLTNTSKIGSNLKDISRAAENIGFKTMGVKISLNDLYKNAPLPCVVFWDNMHFVVVYKVTKNKVYISDPASGLNKYSFKEFLSHWISPTANNNTSEGIVLLLEPTNNLKDPEKKHESIGFKFLFRYILKYRKLLFQLSIGLMCASILQLIFPFLTQSVVDIAIQNKDINFLYLLLVGQLFIFLGRTSIEIFRGWIILHLSSRINISLLSDFLIKLMKLPISFFDSKMVSDIMLRFGDHKSIELLLTNQSLSILFSIFNFIVFGIVLGIYNIPILLIFLVGTVFYFLWVSFFMKKRKSFDKNRFSLNSEENNKLMEIVTGMQEIKLHNAETKKRWALESTQIKLFKLRIKSLKLEQIQSNGSSIINELKNILISFYSAKLVIEGNLTLGMMLSISYIIGQLNVPVTQFLGFIFSIQDAKISIERLSEIHSRNDEEKINKDFKQSIPLNKSLTVCQLKFNYNGFDKNVLEDINLEIPENKTTAIVGASGSGKTTLMKLLLRFYEPNEGIIKIDGIDLDSISHFVWRENIASVMQDGFIFNDTIANNIALSDDIIDKEKLRKAVTIANIKEFIEEQPLNYNTKIGAEGMGISGGQKQRILIARAVYKNPQYIFFDEATSALDANNEKVIMENLNNFFKGRTAVIIAHRLSTVKNADQIVVMDKGRIIEIGTHRELIDQKGSYFNLVKNQLELEKLEAKTN